MVQTALLVGQREPHRVVDRKSARRFSRINRWLFNRDMQSLTVDNGGAV